MIDKTGNSIVEALPPENYRSGGMEHRGITRKPAVKSGD